jgi:hypothetical protein
MAELTREEKAAAAFEGFLGDRWCMRCQHCLSVAYVTAKPQRDVGLVGWACGLCQGPIEAMGKVEYDRLSETIAVSVCDARCTHARGAHCACPCRGKNHGSGRTVTVTYDRGEAPEVDMPTNEVAKATAGTFLAARSAVLVIVKELRELRNRGHLSNAKYYLMNAAEHAVDKATKARTHASRMKYLQAIVIQYANTLA